MAFNYSPKPVIDSSLVLYLDAANSKSYISGSTTWNDISRGGNSGTLTNGPAYSSANGGAIVFDGVDDFVDLVGISLPVSSFTCESLFQWTTAGSSKDTLHSLSYNFPTTGYLIRQADTANGRIVVWSDNGSETSVLSTNAVTFNRWTHLTVVQNNNNCSIYINGILDSSQSLANPVINTSFPYRVGQRGTTGAYLSGRVAISKLYNRTLTPSEILQNYNATKTRFGL